MKRMQVRSNEGILPEPGTSLHIVFLTDHIVAFKERVKWKGKNSGKQYCMSSKTNLG